MTPKNKAVELAQKYHLINKNVSKYWKQCAIIAVDELIKEQTMWQNGEPNPILYWQEVKTEIQKL